MSINYPNSINFAEQLPPAKATFDLVIVGSGAGGGIAAEILSQSGLKVLLVEEGPLRTGKDFSLLEKDAYADLYQEVAARFTQDKAIQILQGRCVGGSTTVNWTSSFRTPEQTLNYWQDEFKLTGFSTKQLAPWFEWAEKRMNISRWLLPPNENNRLLAEGANKLGWSSGVIARNVKGCANLGYCGMGCPIDAKQSMLTTCIPSALSAGASLYSRARVENLIIEQGKVKGVWLSSMDNKGQIKQQNITQVQAQHTILAAGAIGSPAVLMRSGLDKINFNIGKRTFLHPVTASIAKMPQVVDGYQGAPQSIYSDEFLWRDGVNGELGYKIEVPPLHPVLAATLLRHHGSAHADLMADFKHYQANIALMRDGFNPDSQGGQVSLDKQGYPQLDYPQSDVLWRSLREAMLSMTELQFAAGAEKVYPLHMDAKLYSSWSQAKLAIKSLPTKATRWQIMSAHVMGGCAIGGDNVHQVCGPDGNLLGVENLSIMDGSLFPTSLGVNPQLSIYAIAAKLAAQLANKLGGNLPQALVEKLKAQG